MHYFDSLRAGSSFLFNPRPSKHTSNRAAATKETHICVASGAPCADSVERTGATIYPPSTAAGTSYRVLQTTHALHGSGRKSPTDSQPIVSTREGPSSSYGRCRPRLDIKSYSYPPLETCTRTVGYRSCDLEKAAKEMEKDGWSFVSIVQNEYFGHQKIFFERNNPNTYGVIVGLSVREVQKKEKEMSIKRPHWKLDSEKRIGLSNRQLNFCPSN